MDAMIKDRRMGQLIDWYLVQAAKGGHNDAGKPADADDLKRQWAAADRCIDQDFRARPFDEVDASEMQRLIDEIAAGSENDARWVKGILSEVEKFAVRQGVIPALRTKRLICPTGKDNVHILSDGAFRSTWEALHSAGMSGAIVDRSPCLAVLVSAATLQPLGEIVSMRRGEVDISRKLWIRNDPDRYAHLSDLALDLIRASIDLGDFTHRETRTEFVFSSGGPKRDPLRPVSYSLISEVVKRLSDKSATPHDLRETGIAALRMLGGKELRAAVKSISHGGLETVPDAMCVALIDGWAARVRSLTKRQFA